MMILRSLFTVFLFFLLPVHALAEPLAEISFSVSSTHAYATFSEFTLNIHYDSMQAEDSLFSDTTLGNDDDGKTLYAFSSTKYSGLLEFISIITNGLDDQLTFHFIYPGYEDIITKLESVDLGTIGSWPDLRGYDIHSIGVHFSSIDFYFWFYYIGFPYYGIDVTIEGKLLVNPSLTLPPYNLLLPIKPPFID